MKFDNVALDRFLWNLRKKYPEAIIVTGNGRGAEVHAADSAAALGLTVERPKLQQEWYGDAAMDCQVSDVLTGADVIIIVGTGGRTTIALNWLHRMNMHQRDARGKLVKKDGKYVSLRTTPIQYHVL